MFVNAYAHVFQDKGTPPLSSSVTFTLQAVDGDTPVTSTAINISTNTDTPLHLALPLYLAEAWPGMVSGSHL